MSFQDVEAGGLPSARRQQDSSQPLAATLFQINTAVSSFKRLSNSLGTPKDTPALREKLQKARQHIGQLSKETGAKLKSSSDSDRNSSSNIPQSGFYIMRFFSHKPVRKEFDLVGDVSLRLHATKKVSDAKLAKDFQGVLVEFQNAQKNAWDREKVYIPFVPQAVLPASQFSDEFKLMPEDDQEERALFAEQRRQDFLQLENEVVLNEAAIEETEQGIQEIYQQIGEVNEIFKELADLVNEQGYLIDDIDSHIQRANYGTFQGNRQFVKTVKIQKSGSSIICVILVILGVALLLFIIFIVS